MPRTSSLKQLEQNLGTYLQGGPIVRILYEESSLSGEPPREIYGEWQGFTEPGQISLGIPKNEMGDERKYLVADYVLRLDILDPLYLVALLQKGAISPQFMETGVSQEPLPKMWLEEAREEFQAEGAKFCIVVPDPDSAELEKILTASPKARIESTDEAGDDKVVVRLGDGPQEALERDQLRARVGIVPE